MSNYERDPREVAARYRVKKDEKGKFELCSEQGSSVNLSHLGTFLHFKTTPNAVRWHAGHWHSEGAFYVINLLVAELDIGFPGEEGWSSDLVDNCFFVIDGEVLKYLPLTQLRIVSEEQFNVEKSRDAANKLAVEKALAAENGADENGEELTPETKRADDSSLSFWRATITHCRAEPELDIDESLECTIGLPQAHFQQLLDGCLSERVSGAYFHGIGGALSSSFQMGVARDLILLADEGFDVKIDSLTLDYRVEPEVPTKSEEEIEEEPCSPSETEKMLAALERVTAGIGALRSTVITTAWVLAVALIVATFIKS
mgnify:CR=1 FL=1